MHVHRSQAFPALGIKLRNPFWLLAFAIASTMGIFVATRPDTVGTDTFNYRARFLGMVESQEYTTRYEPAFEGMMRAVASLSDAPELFFGLVYTLFLITMIAAMRNATAIVPHSQMKLFPLAALGLLFVSSWFITGSINALRQGSSLGIFYYGVTLIVFRKKWGFGLLLVGIAPLFHLTTITLWPLIVMAPITPLWLVFGIFLAGAAAYTIGATEYLVLIASQLTQIDAYGWVSNYSPGHRHWEGFQADLFAYTVGWVAIYFMGRTLVPQERRISIDGCLKIYMLACIPYFAFGFGNFSNRYGVMAWIFLPIMHAVWIFTARIDQAFKAAITFILLFAGLGRYSLYLSGGF